MAVITISRQFGAGGKTLAQNVADRLGYKIAHEEIIEKVAEKAKVSADSLRSFEAEARGLLQRATSLLTPNRFIDHVLDSLWVPGKSGDYPTATSLVQRRDR